MTTPDDTGPDPDESDEPDETDPAEIEPDSAIRRDTTARLATGSDVVCDRIVGDVGARPTDAGDMVGAGLGGCTAGWPDGAGAGPPARAATRSASDRLRSITAAGTRWPPAVTTVEAAGSPDDSPRSSRRDTEPCGTEAALATPLRRVAVDTVADGRAFTVTDAPTIAAERAGAASARSTAETGPEPDAVDDDRDTSVAAATRRARARVGCAARAVAAARRRTVATEFVAESDDTATPAVRPTSGAAIGERRCTTEAAGAPDVG